MENENLNTPYLPEEESLPKELFNEVNDSRSLHDQAFETKPVSFLRDSLSRFAKNKASIVGAAIILLIALYGLIVPFVTPTAHVDTISYPNGFKDSYFQYVTPYCSWFDGTGFWDGTKTGAVAEDDLAALQYDDSNHPYFVKIESSSTRRVGATKVTTYTIRYDTYAVGNKEVQLSQEEYDALKAYDVQRVSEGKQTILKHIVDSASYLTEYTATLTEKEETLLKEEKEAETGKEYTLTEQDKQDIAGEVSTIITNMRAYYNQNPRVYYAITAETTTGKISSNVFRPIFKDDGTPKEIYKMNSDGTYAEPAKEGGKIKARVDYFDYFTYKNGFEPRFLFGTNGEGQDIFLRLAQGTRFSLLLGVGISLINFVIGLIWGAVSGYYGGYVDLAMERVTDVIGNIPSIIILTICSLQFTNNLSLKASIGEAGILILAFLVAFVYSGWIGVASTTRMQFYRFKGQEYVLASRTLGAKDSRLIFRHILPNAIGTLVTSSVLMIPSVIFSESTLSFLGIMDFSKSNLSSIGTLLSEGQNAGLSSNPHVLLFPCIIISLLMVCFNLFGNGLRDAFNTSLKGADD